MSYIGQNPSVESIVSTGDTLANLILQPREVGRFVWATDQLKYYYDNGTSLISIGSVLSLTTVTKTASATLATSSEENVVVDATAADFTITLPSAVGNNGLTYNIVKSTEANAVTIDADGAEEIGGELTIVMQSKNDSIIIYSDGTNWQISSNDITYAARYTSDSGQSIANNSVQTILFEDIEEDSHGSYNTGTGTFTFSVGGWYSLGASIGYNDLPLSSSEQYKIFIYKNGSQYAQDQQWSRASGISDVSNGIDTEGRFDKDDEISFRVFQNSGSATSLSTDFSKNFFSITRIGD